MSTEMRQALDKDLKDLNKSLQRYEDQLAKGDLSEEDKKFAMESVTYYRAEVKAARLALIEYSKNLKELKA